jgi:hypothetical protein
MSKKQGDAHWWRDTDFALSLLTGVEGTDNRGLPARKPLSHNTKPTEREARAALCRVLWSGDVHRAILDALAAVFSPDADEENFGTGTEFTLLKAHIKRRSQGRANYSRDYEIAKRVDDLRRLNGQSYDAATGSVADQLGMSQHWVKQVCGRMKGEFDPLPRRPRLVRPV